MPLIFIRKVFKFRIGVVTGVGVSVVQILILSEIYTFWQVTMVQCSCGTGELDTISSASKPQYNRDLLILRPAYLQ